MIALVLAVFWAMQVVAQVFFKLGSTAPSRWLVCFVLGNVFGASSIWFQMMLYKRLNPNLALALAGGGAFVCAQLGLALIYHSRPTLVQWLGLSVVAVGMVLATVGGPRSSDAPTATAAVEAAQ